MSKQTQAINKSEVYSHYLGLLFCRILALTAHWGGGKARMPYKNKGKCWKKKTCDSLGGQLATKSWGHSESSFRSNSTGQSCCHLDFSSCSDCIEHHTFCYGVSSPTTHNRSKRRTSTVRQQLAASRKGIKKKDDGKGKEK